MKVTTYLGIAYLCGVKQIQCAAREAAKQQGGYYCAQKLSGKTIRSLQPRGVRKPSPKADAHWSLDSASLRAPISLYAGDYTFIYYY